MLRLQQHPASLAHWKLESVCKTQLALLTSKVPAAVFLASAASWQTFPIVTGLLPLLSFSRVRFNGPRASQVRGMKRYVRKEAMPVAGFRAEVGAFCLLLCLARSVPKSSSTAT